MTPFSEPDPFLSPHVATACATFPPTDYLNKVQKALAIGGPTFIHTYDPCPKGWDYHPRFSNELGELGIKCGIYPLYEIVDGNIIYTWDARKTGKGRIPVKEFLTKQGRFDHLKEEHLRAYSKHGRSNVGRMADPRRGAAKRNIEGQNIRANVRAEKRPRTRGLFFACCLPYKFALFYAQPTSAGSPDQVTSLIPHHRPDWLSPAGLSCSVGNRDDRKKKSGRLHSED